MPVNYTIDADVLHLRMIGEYTPQDIQSAVDEALADSRLPASPRFLFDVRESRALGQRSSGHLRNMASFLGARSEHFGRRLAMVASEQLHFGLLRMAEVYSEEAGLEARAFYHIDDALEWLQTNAQP